MEDQKDYFKGILPPPIIFFALLLISYLAHWLFPVNMVFKDWLIRLFVSIPILAASGWLAIDAIVVLGKNRTAITYNKPATKFIIEKSFRITRNPLYLSLMLLFLSIAVITNSLWCCFSLILLFLFFNQIVVPREENYLEINFGEDYIQYKKNVRRWL
jgi:protein-S-isoprenylcysteine O-methyltransferase Ste14